MKVNNMKISIVLTTYNGERFILEQLNSIFKQTIRPDEVLIIDDCSDDNTYTIIEKYIEKNNLNNWCLLKNEKNLGWKKNFMKGIEKARGELIFLCDQDDIWELNKIETQVQIMLNNKDILVLASNYTPIYSKETKKYISKKIMRTMNNDGSVVKYKLNSLFFYVLRPGCTFCFRKKILKYVKNIWFEGYAHDAIIWHIAILLNGLYIYNSATIQFRRHNKNASNLVSKEDRKEIFHDSIEELKRLKKLYLENIVLRDEKKISYIDKNIRMYKKRIELLETKSIKVLLSLIFQYYDCYLTFKSFLGDVYFAYFKY